MNRWAYIAVGVLVYVAVLIAAAPASLIAKTATRFSDGAVSLASAHGSVWRGGARLYVGRGTETQPLGDIAWHIQPLWLFTGRLRARFVVNAPDVDLDVTASLSISRLSLQDFHAAFPAAVIAKVYPPAQLLGPQGAVRIEGKKFELGRRRARGEAVITWRQAASHMTNVQPLGDYRLQASGRGDSVGLELKTLKGSLNVTGRGAWRLADGSLKFNGRARPTARAGELEPLLKLLGPDRGKGQRAISINLRPGA